MDLRRPSENFGLWLDSDEQVIAFTALYDAFPLDLFIAPQVSHRAELFNDMLDWVEAHWALANNRKGSPNPLRIACLATHEKRIGILESRGYKLGQKTYTRLTKPLGRNEETKSLPKGMLIRPMRCPDDVDLFVNLHNSVFDTLQLDRQRIERVMTSPWYSPDFSCLVETDDRQAVAFAIGCLDRSCRTLEFEPVGCLKPWRRRGLTRALLLEIMARAARAGAEQASLTAPGTNHGTIAFYHATGFTRYVREVEYFKPAR